MFRIYGVLYQASQIKLAHQDQQIVNNILSIVHDILHRSHSNAARRQNKGTLNDWESARNLANKPASVAEFLRGESSSTSSRFGQETLSRP